MKITKSYLKQIIKEEMEKMKLSLLPIQDQAGFKTDADILKDILIKQGPSGLKNDGAETYVNFTWWIDHVRDEKKKAQLMGELKQAINISNVVKRPLQPEVEQKINTIIDTIAETIMNDPDIFQQQVQKK